MHIFTVQNQFIMPNRFSLLCIIGIICILSFTGCNKDQVEGAKLPGTTNKPCSSIQRVEYQGMTYNTIQIGNQCWMRENLNVGEFVASSTTNYIHSDASNNGVIEKYCYDNLVKNCIKYGGLYDWDEMMNYVDSEGTQGICPAGWHIPTDHDFYELERWIDSKIPSPDTVGWRGKDAGMNMKNGYTSGFDALLSGYRYFDGTFILKEDAGYFWSSSETSAYHVLFRNLYTMYDKVYRNRYTVKQSAFSVRCLKN